MTFVVDAIGLIDRVRGVPTPEQTKAHQDLMECQHLTAIGLLPHEMGGIATKGCDRCGGTIYLTQESDGSQQWVCSGCGGVE